MTQHAALVTGATSGIGRAVALGLAADGFRVLVSGRDASRGQAVVDEITAAGGRADFLAADLAAGAEAASDLARRARELTGDTVSVLVNNAGVYPFVATTETDDATFAQVFDLNVRAPYFLTAGLVAPMAALGGGTVVNISTIVASVGMPTAGLYGASKAAVESLTRTWATEFAADGVRVNAVAAGPLRTPGTAPMGDGLDALGSTTPLGRVGDPEEIAAAVRWLASPASAYVTGAVVPVDGGRLAA